VTDLSVKPSSDLAVRTVVGLAMVTVALGALWLGDIAFWLFTTLLAIGVVREWAGLVGVDRATTRMMMLVLSVPLAIMCPLAAGPHFFALGLIFGAAFFIALVTRHDMPAFGMLYAGLPVLGLLVMRSEPRGLLFCFWALGLVWACDVGAYFVGRMVGGAKLAPTISPNKTWAGLIGGIVIATLFAVILHVMSGLPWRLLLATPALALLAQIGDLFESWLKRRAGVKDSGNLLPGHGGLLDRLDGVVPVTPIAALLVIAPKIQGLF